MQPATDPHRPDGACPGIHRCGVPVMENRPLARDTYRLRLECGDLAEALRVGQFVMLRLNAAQDPLIGRAFALYDAGPGWLEVVYQVHGKLTRRLAELRAGDRLDVWGPLGNGFSLSETRHLIIVAGGIGYTPFLALAREYLGQRRYGADMAAMSPVRPRAEQVSVCYGVRSADYLASLAEWHSMGVAVRVATDDGSSGHHGLVTDLLRQVLGSEFPPGESEKQEAAPVRVVCCGPEPMMAAVTELVAQYPGVPLEVSLETPMACGIGICFSCVARIRQPDGSWDYRRTCMEGPIFAGQDVVW